MIEVPTGDGEMGLYEAVPDGDALTRAVIVLQEAFGVNDHIQDVTRRFAAAGYRAAAPVLFHRTATDAAGPQIAYDAFGDVIAHFAPVTDDSVLADVDAALAHLASEGIPPEAVGVVGFCFGGRASFLVAAERALGAGVGFYGGGIVTSRFPQFPSLLDRAATLQTPWLGLFGDQDATIPVDDVEALRAALPGADVDTEIVRYADADHGFHCDARPQYSADPAADAWARTLAWLDAHLA